jgi:uncharacterized protein (DUF983 family)
MRLFFATLLMRCPRCHQGKVYRWSMRMNQECPICGLRFEREEGYFVGAMYASYGFQFLTITPVLFVLLLTTESAWTTLGVTIPQALIQAPVAYLYSRVIWMAVDSYFDPLPPWDGVPVGSESS